MVKVFSPSRRAATPEEVADYVLFLCSPSASYVNGTRLLIDSGLTMRVTGAGLILESHPKQTAALFKVDVGISLLGTGVVNIA
jgi:hypothetical protein